MEPVTLTTTIARPREEVFEYLADVANHAEFTDHCLVDWHLTREDSYGRGAGGRFRDEVALRPLLLRRPHARRGRSRRERIVATGRAGRFNRVRTRSEWTLEDDGQRRHARRRSTTESTPATFADRQMEKLLRRARVDDALPPQARSTGCARSSRPASSVARARSVSGGARKPATRLQAVDFAPPVTRPRRLARPARRPARLAAA